MSYSRSSGILLHPTSLPGRHGIGSLGPEAYRFIDFLHGASQQIWQVLPLGPTGYGDSPYQCFSAFAGNPLLISLDKLAEDGLLSEDDLAGAPSFSDEEVDYGPVAEFKLPLLRRAFKNFKRRASQHDRDDFASFCHRAAFWLDDYALFMAIREAHSYALWTNWEKEIADRQPQAIAYWSEKLADEIQARKYWEYLFFKQWTELRDYCHQQDIKIMGDMPIFISHDSADVWAHRELFHLDERGNPTVVAGVPPDYFSETGQLWGNPLYRWDAVARTGYQWWIDRLRSILLLVDIVRLDHFRGFEAYWEVPATEKTAVNGRWVKGPGVALFNALEKALGKVPIVAENLGTITPEVEQLREQCGFPGMAILQFAFVGDPKTSVHVPHNYVRNTVAYTGNHDNDTIVGWWAGENNGASTRSLDEISREKAFAKRYLDTDGHEINWVVIRAILASVAEMAIIPLQDVLGLGSEARMNVPARPSGNWRWRYRSEMLTKEIQERLRELTVIYGRSSA